MIIAVAGPYSAPTGEQRQANLDAMNKAAARLLEKGHIPLIGMNAALPVLQYANIPDLYKATMDISMAVIDRCEAILLLAESPGANRERDHVAAKGYPVYYSVEEVPENNILDNAEKFLIATLSLLKHNFDNETISSIEHYIKHAEYEMAFEGMFIEIMKLKSRPLIDLKESIAIAISLQLNEVTVFDIEFWKKFETYANTK